MTNPLVTALIAAVHDASFALHDGPTDEDFRRAAGVKRLAMERLSAVLAAARAVVETNRADREPLWGAIGELERALAAADGAR